MYCSYLVILITKHLIILIVFQNSEGHLRGIPPIVLLIAWDL